MMKKKKKTVWLRQRRWWRVILKISGAVLAGTGPQNVDSKVMMLIAKEVAAATRLGAEAAIVTGGRNFFCGDTWVATAGIDRTTAYQLGMMTTVMNSILLQTSLEKMGVQTRVQTAFIMQEVAKPYNRQRAIRHLKKRRKPDVRGWFGSCSKQRKPWLRCGFRKRELALHLRPAA